MFATALRDSQF